MENKNIFQKFKEFYQSKRGRAILFFGFYLIFFLVLTIAFKNANNMDNKNKVNNANKESEIKENTSLYSMKNLLDNNFNYNIEVVDDDKIETFTGTKNNVDYNNFDNKYFFDIYNLNQLIKKSKFIKTEENVYYYVIDNNTLNSILNVEKENGINKINVYASNSQVEKITLDLSEFMAKENYRITISYSEVL